MAKTGFSKLVIVGIWSVTPIFIFFEIIFHLEEGLDVVLRKF